MGADQSLQRLNIPLHAQHPPMLSTAQGIVTQGTTRLEVIFKPAGSKLLVVNGVNHSLEYEFMRPETFCSQRILETKTGFPLMSIWGKRFSADFNVFEGADTTSVKFTIAVYRCMPRIMFADFTDRLTGLPCRLAIAGRTDTSVALVYMERGQLSAIGTDNNIENGRYVPVARLHRKHNGLFRGISRLVEIAEGVDVSLVLVLLLIREERFIRKHTRGSFRS